MCKLAVHSVHLPLLTTYCSGANVANTRLALFLVKQYKVYLMFLGVFFFSVGNSDGVYKGKRYFNCSSQHGVFLTITNIVKVFNKEVCVHNIFLKITT